MNTFVEKFLQIYYIISLFLIVLWYGDISKFI